MSASERPEAQVQIPPAQRWGWRRGPPCHPQQGHQGRTRILALPMELQEQLGHFAFHFPEHSWAKAHPAPRGNKDVSPAEAIPRSYQHQSPSRHSGAGPLVAPQAARPGTSTATDLLHSSEILFLSPETNVFSAAAPGFVPQIKADAGPPAHGEVPTAPRQGSAELLLGGAPSPSAAAAHHSPAEGRDKVTPLLPTPLFSTSLIMLLA